MCTTLLLLSTLAMLWRRRFANRVQPEPSEVGVDGVVAGSSVDTDPQSSGSFSGSAAWAAGRIRCPVPNRRRRRSMTSSALAAIGWAAPSGRPLSPVARKLTLP
ncbi:photoreceptor disk component PRCD isoform X2 [Phyllostomus discolor]|uniref:Photoreceptor disk component PRCD isoform X2 n=1 Tax=Phyllostomus discolor TaxID=89673 RepID=A0A7E6EEP7_9CHIR|nr:photoreceptor disk component PRCD isoform X2 [Phyllostomus discolor]